MSNLASIPSALTRAERKAILHAVRERDSLQCVWCSRITPSASLATFCRLLPENYFPHSIYELDNYVLSCLKCAAHSDQQKLGLRAWNLQVQGQRKVRIVILKERFERLLALETRDCIVAYIQEQLDGLGGFKQKYMTKNVRHRHNKMLRIRMRDGDACTWCNKYLPHLSPEVTFDHVITRNDSGCNKTSNIVLACSACNNARSHLPVSEWVLQRPEAQHSNVSASLLSSCSSHDQHMQSKAMEEYPLFIEAVASLSRNAEECVGILEMKSKNHQLEQIAG